MARDAVKYKKYIGRVNEKVGSVVEYTGTAIKYIGFVATPFAPEFGIPISEVGQGIELAGVGIQVAQDVSNGDYGSAAQKVVMEVAGAKTVKMANSFVKSGVKEGAKNLKTAASIFIEANVDVTKEAINTITDKKNKK